MTTWFKYVPHGEFLFYLASGWILADDLIGTPHGNYACLMQWTGDGEPK